MATPTAAVTPTPSPKQFPTPVSTCKVDAFDVSIHITQTSVEETLSGRIEIRFDGADYHMRTLEDGTDRYADLISKDGIMYHSENGGPWDTGLDAPPEDASWVCFEDASSYTLLESGIESEDGYLTHYLANPGIGNEDTGDALYDMFTREVWVNSDGYIVKVREDGQRDKVRTVSVTRLSGFGEKNAITAPLVGTATPTPVATATPTPGSAAGAGLPPEPHQYATAALEQRIFWADSIVRASFVSVAPEVDVFNHPSLDAPVYRPVQKLEFNVREYLKGAGASTVAVTAVIGEVSQGYSTRAAAREAAENSIIERTTAWDDREGIIFLNTPSNSAPWWADTWAEAVAATADTKEFIFTPTAGEPGDYAIDTPNRVWLPAKEVAGVPGDSRIFLVGGQREDGSHPEMSLAALRAQISASVADIEANKHVQGYKECINKKLDYERYYRGWSVLRGAWTPGVADYAITSDTRTIRSTRRVGKWGHYSQFWHTGKDADLFIAQVTDDDNNPENGYSEATVTARPLPAGLYSYYAHERSYQYIPCNFTPDKSYVELKITVTAPTNAIHEAFFDPVNVGETDDDDATNGVLKPTDFTVSGSSATITKIAWEGGKATMEFQPSVSLAGHHADFIGLDGKVALRLDFDDAKVTTSGTKRTFEWGMSEQPWVSGDLLMLRISRTPPSQPSPRRGGRDQAGRSALDSRFRGNDEEKGGEVPPAQERRGRLSGASRRCSRGRCPSRWRGRPSGCPGGRRRSHG